MTKYSERHMGRPGKKLDRVEDDNQLSSNGALIDPSIVRAAVSCGDTPELSYSAAIPLAHRRRYAQFFTPPKIAKLMAEWAITPSTKTLLEPALGMGVLVRAAFARNADLKITAFEKDPVILRSFLGTHPDLSGLEVLLEDFLTNRLISHFDAVLMNPPYLRHHDLSYNFDIFSHFSSAYGVEISRLSNAYFLFTLKAAMSLNPGGRASIIIPTEWMNANFGTAMKKFLVAQNFLREMIYFSSCSEIFEDALTTACVLFLERSEP